MSTSLLLVIGLGGALGALLRALAGRLIQTDFPIATLLVNVMGSGLLAAAWVYLPETSPLWRAFIGTGLCGALTTFSTFILETVLLFRNGFRRQAVLYVLATVVLCCLASWGGFYLMR